MFDVAPSELLLVALVALVVIGPKDLPRAMRVVGRWMGKARTLSRHFRSGVDEMIRQAEMEEMEKRWAEENAKLLAESQSEATEPQPQPAVVAETVPVPDHKTPVVLEKTSENSLKEKSGQQEKQS
ncbi:Sec-independent protein translocase protein TatB [Zymomonas mobilis]|uniref:Twin-arginine translocation protein, TatB subunit n=1 Tax=Zymomonas mobilis subsp. pomaceae (strain ATCC 29192 / DSM 22645 / JCM 10191 / CCUG 17912 / NBRC 13757 / NCIMB 11200 / NRRL B-4491 / Barker I) TaxID=579138 RepID=F8ETA2_ZYMMT|nr:twin-arginine translocation protein, TatB subunit [Zymomonas mobilis subsp. pomaceae ATCC 29192]GEB89647.1 Sec-independent protein translocase protein TatB [Zymomonas mobilis subsp. pomaceae]